MRGPIRHLGWYPPAACLALLTILIASTATAAASADDAARDGIELQHYWSALELVGFKGVGLVDRAGVLEWLQGAGGVDPRATFDLASIAKSITAVAVLRLSKRGLLPLDATLPRFFPDVPAEKRTITVQQLLTHTSGLGNPTGDTAAGETDRARAVRKILATPLVEPPGTRFSYSNDGYTILAAILEVVAGERWERVIREEIYVPARMEHAGFVGDPPPREGFAIADPGASRFLAERHANWGAKGGAGIYATAEDLRRFIHALADGTLLGPGGPAELGTSFADPESAIQYSRAFALMRSPGRGLQWQHGGADTESNHYSMLEYYPESSVTLILLSAGSEPLEHAAMSGLEKIVFHEGHPRMPPSRLGKPASGFGRTILDGRGLHFAIQPSNGSSYLLPLDAASTAFLVANDESERKALDADIERTRVLLARMERKTAKEVLSTSEVERRFLEYWSTEATKKGAARQETILGAVPNWVDDLGGALVFVRVDRERGASLFRLYWKDGVLKARGGEAIPSPAPLELIAYNDREYGAWNPALDTYASLTFEAAVQSASGRVRLRVGDAEVILEARPAR